LLDAIHTALFLNGADHHRSNNGQALNNRATFIQKEPLEIHWYLLPVWYQKKK
jgi:hypothetical protein